MKLQEAEVVTEVGFKYMRSTIQSWMSVERSFGVKYNRRDSSKSQSGGYKMALRTAVIDGLERVVQTSV